MKELILEEIKKLADLNKDGELNYHDLLALIQYLLTIYKGKK